MKTLTESNCVVLEKLVDASSVRDVLAVLGVICREKADHIRSNWQDEKTADHWDHLAHIVESAERKAAH